VLLVFVPVILYHKKSLMLFSLLALFFFDFQLPSGKILGLAKFFLAIGIQGDAKDLFNQVDSLAFLESNT
jgi:hypothetical protein